MATIAELEAMEVGTVQSHFLDSGSFTLWTKSAKYAQDNGVGPYDYYDLPEFFEYMDRYAAFIKKHQYGIDLYANVDAIPHAELSYRNQRYLMDKHGLTPVPVVHYKTDLKWLKRYMDEGHNIIALGGLVGSTSQDGCKGWIDRCFEMICDQPSRLPKVRIHGFGVTNWDLMRRYPWWSVDSTSWTKVGAFGGVLVPHLRGGVQSLNEDQEVIITGGEFTFDEQPYVAKMSIDSPDVKIEGGLHFWTLGAGPRGLIERWLNHIGIPLGSVIIGGERVVEMPFPTKDVQAVHAYVRKDEARERKRQMADPKYKLPMEERWVQPHEFGVITRHTERRAANLLFFEHFRKTLPKWPWPFTSTRRKGFLY